jgi:hypothetical protein
MNIFEQNAQAEQLARSAAQREADAVEEKRAKLIAEAAKLPTLSTERVGEIMRELAVAQPAAVSRMEPAVSVSEVEMVSITKAEYDRLVERDDWLGWLEAAGVDNWQGIDEARDMRNADREERMSAS